MGWLHRLFMRDDEREQAEQHEQAKADEMDEVLATSAEVIREKDRVTDEFRRAEAAMRARTGHVR